MILSSRKMIANIIEKKVLVLTIGYVIVTPSLLKPMSLKTLATPGAKIPARTKYSAPLMTNWPTGQSMNAINHWRAVLITSEKRALVLGLLYRRPFFVGMADKPLRRAVAMAYNSPYK